MPKTENLPLYQKLFALNKSLYKIVNNLPKEYKFSLGADTVNYCWRCLDSVLEANLRPNVKKNEPLEDLSVNFDKLKLRLRMMQEVNLISLGQFAHLQENYLSEIGKMIGGWQKWAEGGVEKEQKSRSLG